VLAQDVDLVVNITGDQPAYMAQDMQSFTVTVSNNGPDTATNVELVVTHPIAETPFDDSATCQALPGANPNGPAVCPPGTGTAPSAAFVRSGQTFTVTLPEIPALSQAQIDFQTQVHCPPAGLGEPVCFGVPTGNFLVSADVSSAEIESNGVTNGSTTNVFLFPPDVQYAVDIVEAPTTATPGSVVEYEFELYSFGLQPSDLLNLNVEIRGEAGTMTPLSVSNHPLGASGSTLPNTELLSIDCVSSSLGSYPPASVFPASPAPWQTCPSTGLIPIPTPGSPQNAAPVTGFPTGNFLANLPGTLDGPPGGGVMRFRAQVLVGDPVCVSAPESGVRDLVFEFSVQGLQGTDLVSPGPADNTSTVVAEVPGNCEVADVEFTTQSVPATPALDSNGDASWVQEVTVTNLSTGPSAGTATDVAFEFEHHSLAFAHSYGALSCSSSPSGLCPSSTALSNGIVSVGNSHFRFASMIDALPPGASVTVSLPVDISRTTCWGSNTADIDLRGQASPSPALYDPIYSTTTPPEPPPFTTGLNSFFGNNGLQTITPVTGLGVCPGGLPQSFIEVEKSGPFASAADAAAGTPLIGQAPVDFIADGTEVFYKIVVTNPNTVNAVPLGELNDFNFNLPGLASTPPSGFVHSGNDLSDWGITCTPAPASADCHDLASTFTTTGYTNSFTFSYDPTLHGGDSEVPLAPEATLTYIVPFTMPVHLNRCHDPELTSNNVTARYVNAAGELVSTPQSIVDQYIGMPPCTPGALEIDKAILPPATGTTIPVSGEISWSVTLTNASASETLDIPRFVDETFAFGVDATIVNIDCNALSGGAQCPPTPVLPGVQTPASGPTSPLSNPLHIDHEWGAIGDNTFPPGGSIEFVITAQLANPTSMFGCVFNQAAFNAPNDPNGWIPAEDSATSCPPPAPELSVQKTVSPQMAAPGDTVTYTVTVVNIGSASADGAVLVDPLPPALLPANPGGYVNVSCNDISNSTFIPNPQGTAVCPPITSGPTGLQATVAAFGPNTGLEFTYQAVMPDSIVSVDNQATVSAPSSGGLSFGAGTAQSQQNVQVQSGTTGEPPIVPPDAAAPVPSLTPWAIALLALLMLITASRVGLLRARA
jgi:uncharacterized repeat protein (TIGR01451 family)